MTAKELQAEIAHIKQSTASSTTCTPNTVSRLKSLLFPEISNNAAPKKDAVAPKSHVGQPKKGGRPKARKQPDVAILEAPSDTTIPLNDSDRERLATEVVNSVLKAFSEAARSPSPAKARSKADNAPHTTSRRSTTSSPQRPKSPLQPLCVNRVLLGKKQHKGPRHSGSMNSTEAASGMGAQAECARLALSILRTYQARKALGEAPQPLKIELAMSTLISKLIALGMFDSAVRELRVLKRSLLVALEGAQNAESASVEKATSKPTTTDLLVFPTTTTKGPLLAMVVTFQLHVMRLIVAKGDASMCEASIEHLATKVPYSPANMIQAQLDSADASTSVKVANQLETLSQMIASMSRSLPCPADPSASSRSMNPLTVLRLGLLSLELRCQWWKVAGHTGNAARDLLDPLNRFVGAFRRQCTARLVDGYHAAKDTFYSLESSVRNFEAPQISLPAWYEASRAIYCEMVDFARACSLDDEGKGWLEAYLKQPVDELISPCSKCTEACKRATMFAQYHTSLYNKKETEEALQRAVRHMEGDLHGSSEELDSLLLAVIKLRKAAGIIINKSQAPLRNKETPLSPEFIRHFSNACSSSVAFLNRYIGTKPAQSNQQIIRRYQERLQKASVVSRIFIDSVVSIARLSKGDEPDQWARTEAGLQGCLRLAALSESDHTSTGSDIPLDKTLSTCVSVSNAYWLRYLHLKQNIHDVEEARTTLKASISAVEKRPFRERSAAQLQVRLEHYAYAMETSREYQKAAEANEKALRMHIEMGDLDRAAAAAGSQTLMALFARESEFASLGRILVAYTRVAIKVKSKVPTLGFFDDEQINPACRGIALEQQLASLITQARTRSGETQTTSIIQAVAVRLLALYQARTYPVRRLRVTETLLWLQSNFPGILSSDILKLLGVDRHIEASDGGEGSDSGLHFAIPHLAASRDAASAIQNESSVSMQHQLDSALGTWHHQIIQYTDLRGLETVVGDTCVWLLHLELLADYLDAYGLGLLRLSILELLYKVREKFAPSDTVPLVLNLTQYGLQHLRLGHIKSAGIAFHRAHEYIREAEVIKKAGIFYYTGYAEYLLAIGSVSKCEENLAAARVIFEDNARHDQIHSTGTHTDIHRISMDVASLSSQLAARQGHPSLALMFARQGLRIASRTWSRISKRQRISRSLDPDSGHKEDSEGLEDSTAGAMVSGNDRSEMDAAISNRSPELWSLIPRLHRAFIQVAELYSDEGMSAEAKSYLERSRKFAESISASGLLGQSLVQLSDIMTRSEDHAGAKSSFDRAGQLYLSLEKDQQKVMFQLNLSKYQLAKGELSAAEATCGLAESMLQHFTAMALNKDSLANGSNVDLIQEQLSKVNLREDVPCLPTGKKRIPVKGAASKVARAGKGSKIVQKGSSDAPASSSSGLPGFRSGILNQQVMLALRKENFERVNNLVAEAAARYCTPRDVVFHAAATAELLIRRGIDAMTGDPVFCVLPESTISLPSLLPIGPLSPLIVPRAKQTKPTKGSGKGVTAPIRNPKVQTSSHDSDDSLCQYFREAQMGINRVYELAQRSCTTATLHHLSKLMAETRMVLSALGLSCSAESSGLSPSMALSILDMPKSIAAQRGQRAVHVEKTMTEDNTLCWPADKAGPMAESMPSVQPLNAASFQKQYLDIIPQSWQVLTITLSRARGEILVSRLRSGQGPFILSMPLDRHSSRDPDEESFNYSQAKAELQDIIALTDKSTHSMQDTSAKGARSAWWTERAALDARLRDLLTNIEYMWFGGFHGVFSPRVPHRDLLSRFQVSLNAVLDSHLPSRQGQGRKQQSKQITLDPRVAELFVALGEPSNLGEMEEPLTDLLYFVIDILQFCGERNAYDEVDFDSMAIATFDALRQYHEAAKGVAEPLAVQHTILILDKELHCFPWESLPCLNNQAVTRLPSLSCLRDRILQQRGDDTSDGENKFCVDRRSGAYVLNPAGDLQATQETFEQPLNDLGGWEGLTGVAPSEEQMKGYLQDRDIFLYFGHGSGSHYMRARTFQQLERCAVALLMGCSSGKLTEAGEFEPYGTPVSYMQTGCAAMLATLWDVTDKDIDRFSESVLQKWGLFPGQPGPDSSPVKRTARSRGKSKIRPSPPESENMSLDQAVARARGSCIFRYLNGAAPVVYGIPVFVG
ncbi:MAG: hypothetical protein Q9168_002611 [Polycauliona sp. 1 TL-2023]